ncbi:ABC transporter substrate-binding protein [Liquorilactobacillus mali]|uniref:ABC transporter substrate-binding protein n=1 Tax=Liquorilactobacillus mali TaxID=1618 RepID=UPI000249229E|nr:NrtA/SsuA/CpmA family ABC transporter substrate-binding protein [Liquorilactobacillus mali]QFQ73816.1 transporter substrate-binding domain-containing protein [Liquorilactobacillus mali]
MHKKLIVLLGSLVAIIAVIFAAIYGLKNIDSSSKKSSGNSTTIRLGLMTNSGGQYLAAIAKKEGYFSKYNLKVKTTTFSSGIETVNAITTKQLDIGYVADFAALNRFGSSSKSNLKIFAKLSSSGGSGVKLYTTKDISSLADLKGKNVLTSTGTVTEYWVAKALKKGGLKESQVNLLSVETGQEGLALMKSGKASAVWASGQDAEKLEKTGKFKVLTTQGKITSPTLAFAISNKKFLKEHPKAAIAYLKAINDSIKLVHSHPQKAAKIVSSALNVPTKTVLATFKSTNFKINFDQSTYNDLKSIYKYLANSGKLKHTYNINKYLDTTTLKKAISGSVSYK